METTSRFSILSILFIILVGVVGIFLSHFIGKELTMVLMAVFALLGIAFAD